MELTQDGSEPGIARHVDPEGILHVVFDRPGEKVNLLTVEGLAFLDRLFDEIAAREDLRGVLLESGKPGVFLAGFDLGAVASARDAYEAAEGSRRGQSVFQKLAKLAVPSACAIGGVCIGAGSELALACTFRVASDDPRVRIAFPEVQLGIIPGFGGTQRLPRLVGFSRALDLVLTGRELDGARAAAIGLVDRVVPHERLAREAAARLLEPRRGAARPRRSLLSLAIDSVDPLRRYVLGRARKKLMSRFSPSDYPAPFRAMEALEAAFTMPLAQGLDLEARIVGELVPTRTSRNLVELFRSRTALKKDTAGYEATPRRIRKVAVVGSGIMGGGIAQVVADHEISVRLRDVRYEALLGGLRAARKAWDEAAAKGRVSARDVAQRIEFISPTLDESGMSRADLVVEAVVEDLALKQRIVAEAEARIGERAVLASNTSTLPITEIAARAMHPERIVGLHFFNPVHLMPLVEVIPGQRTSPEAVATVHAFAIDLGKTPVVVRDSPGFLVNRILGAYLNEALRLLAEGVRIEALDRAMRSFGMPLGPCALLDHVGLDTARNAAAVLEAAFGKRIGGSTALLEAMVADGRLGAKNGRGFFRYKDGRAAVADRGVYRLAGGAPPLDLPVETLQERMTLCMVNEASVCLEDGVAKEPRDVDVAMILGAGYPPFRGGPLRYADAIGIPVLVDRLSRLADAQGDRFRPAGLLRDLAREERSFYPPNP